MNAKKAKQLRRIAQRATVGVPQASKILSPLGDCIVNNPHGTRGLYHTLKRQVRLA